MLREISLISSFSWIRHRWKKNNKSKLVSDAEAKETEEWTLSVKQTKKNMFCAFGFNKNKHKEPGSRWEMQ